MRSSQFFISTLKEAPSEAELLSHKLMLRAGLIKKLGSGLYTWMPLGLRVLRRVEHVVREEMNRAGAVELLMPAVQPAELWQETGRWEAFGPQMLKIKDRHERDFCFGPTHEEVITDIARREIRSYRQLPLNFYQIQTKFRDEIRPRFGVMRAREFMMKDAYSFHANHQDLEREYRNMYDAYARIFSRLGLKFRAVAADTGAIGGTGSHEFHVLADAGEDAIAYSPVSDYAANVELAEGMAPTITRPSATKAIEKVSTPGKRTIADVSEFLGVPSQKILKTLLVVTADQNRWLILLRGDHELNETKLSKVPQFSGFRFATEEEIRAINSRPGYLGPVNRGLGMIVDRSASVMSDFVCGADEGGFHYINANFGRDFLDPLPFKILDIRNAVAGDPSPDGKGTLEICRGIEVGHIFQLRTKYSEAMKATFLDEGGKAQVLEMGCYGIGVSRIVAAAIEQGNDEKGIIWPLPMAPFKVAIAPIGYRKNAEIKKVADQLHDELQAAGIDVLLDDRDERPGVMFADLELIGVPHRVTIGDRGLKEGKVEYQARTEKAATTIDLQVAAGHLISLCG